MLGHGDWNKSVPREPVENVRWRLRLLEKCRTSYAMRRDVIHACKQDIIFYVDAFVLFHNPLIKVGPKIGPFILWDFQEKVLLRTLERWCEKGKDYLWEKSREMGATWLALILADWLCLFHQWEQCMTVSHSLIAVDNGDDPNTLFWKLRFIHKHLPPWMLRGVKDATNKKNPMITYPKTNGAITGYASTGRSGVGGRGKVILDELGKQDRAHEVVGNTADVGPRLFISTHYGVGTEFFRLCERADLPKEIMHWSQHPEKNPGLYQFSETEGVQFLDKQLRVIPKEQSDFNWPEDYPFICDGTPTGGPFPGVRSPWYDEECSRRDDKRQVAMHLDIDAQGSDSQFFDAIVLRNLRLTYCSAPKWQGDLEYDPIKGQPIRLVEREGGPLKLWQCPDGYGKFPLSKYGAGTDISAGVGTTNTALVVGDSATGRKILEFTDPYMSGEKFGPKAVAICRMFKGPNIDGALLVWEQQYGTAFANGVIGCGYRRFYKQKTKQAKDMNVKYSDRPGLNMNTEMKHEVLVDYRWALTNRRFINPSEYALNECLNFRINLNAQVEHAQEATTDDPTGAKANHGDVTMADAMCWMMMAELGGIEPKGELEKKVVVGGWEWRRMEAERMIRELEEDAA